MLSLILKNISIWIKSKNNDYILMKKNVSIHYVFFFSILNLFIFCISMISNCYVIVCHSLKNKHNMIYL